MTKKILKWGCLVIIGIYVLVCLSVMVMPQWYFYNPSSQKSDIKHANEYDYPAREVEYKSEDGTPLLAWATLQNPGKKMIVFFHGNAVNLEEFYHKMKAFAYDGYGTFMAEYRGFGGLKGKINQKNLEADAIAAIQFLNKHGYKNSDIYLYGMSLGSHMALNTAAQLQKNGNFAGIILEVPFDSLAHTAQKRVPYLPLKLLIRDKYDNMEIIKQIKNPIFIMGASEDKTVPVELAKILYEQAQSPKKMIIYKNGKHGNLFNFRNDLDILNWMEMNEKSIY